MKVTVRGKEVQLREGVTIFKCINQPKVTFLYQELTYIDADMMILARGQVIGTTSMIDPRDIDEFFEVINPEGKDFAPIEDKDYAVGDLIIVKDYGQSFGTYEKMFRALKFDSTYINHCVDGDIGRIFHIFTTYIN